MAWGRGNTVDITSWSGIKVEDQRVAAILLPRKGISGDIPPELSRLTHLTQLNLAGNDFTGPIPSQLSLLTKLEVLYLYRNELSGPIPVEFSRLINLKRLKLGTNRLTGQIPSQIFRLTNLETFDIIFNEITGHIPIEFTRLTNLTWLNLANNSFTGSIPSQLFRLTKLELLNLYGNELSGPIPVELVNLPNLKGLHLGGNDLTGQIPAELSQLTKLEALSLSGNNLTGSIPTELSQLTNLKELDLKENELTGSIPSQFSLLSNLRILDLKNNQLTGPIPPELSKLTQLRYLYLGFNRLTGSIPPQFSRLTYLIVLDISYNQLSGPIPPGLSQLEYLRSLILEYNQLSGPIPPELSQLKYLRHLSLFFNQFTDPIPPQIIKREDLNIRSPFDTDLGLVVNVEEYRKITLGNKIWEVWLCDTGGPLDLDIDRVTDLLNRTVAPYFEWLSEGLFTPRFSAIGTITLTPRELANLPNTPPGAFSFHPLVACEDKMMRSVAHDKMNKAVIIDNAAHSNGLSLPHALAGGGSVMPIPGYDRTPRLMTVAHEMGHVLGWPHSYNGYMISEGVFDDYDNSADIMSRGNNKDLSTGTPAINRYAAGWIDSEDVVIYSGEATTHELSPIGVDGTQMLIVPSEEGQGIFYSLSPVIAEGYNRDQPKEGVEVYFIDQGLSICDLNIHTTLPCRRTQPYPPQTEEPVRGSVYHVRGVGDVFQLGEVWLEIRERRGDRFTVAVGSGCGGYFEGRFCDDEGSVHSDSIEAIAGWEITQGCGTNEFCPDAVIPRRQMAAFLYRAVIHRYGEPSIDSEVTLGDVEDGAWYRLYARWAAAAGVMQAPDGVFDPDGLVTRADMAEMMTAAFGHITLPASHRGVFTDLDGQPDRVVRAAEALRTAGVTAGCRASPLRFCPDQPITRAQMASFLHRALS